MNSIACTCAIAVLTSVATAHAAPRISDTYPPAEDLRTPDRTIAHPAPFSVIVYSPEGRLAATAGGDKVVRVWSARTGEEDTGAMLSALEGSSRVVALGWRREGSALVVLGADGTLTEWGPTTGNLLRSDKLKTGVAIAAFRPGNDPWLAGVAGDAIVLVDHNAGIELRRFEAAGAKVRVLAFSGDGKTLVAATDKGLRLWEVASGKLTRSIEGVAARAIAASATHVAATAADGVVRLWKIEGDAPAQELRAHKGAVNALAFNNKGEQLATGGADKLVRVWDVGTARLLSAQEGHTGAVVAVAMNPNGQKLASGGDRSLRYGTVPLPPLPPADLEKITAAVPTKASVPPKKPRKLLVIWRADAILHKGGVPAANKAIELMGKRTGAFTTDFTRDTAAFDPKVLAKYDAIVFNSTAHLVITDPAQKRALLDYVEGGGGVVGVHAAIDMFKRWPEGAKIVGATFGGHPWHPTGTWSVRLDEPAHPLLRAWGGKGVKMHDEFYELAEPYTRDDRRVLMSLDVADPATTAVTPLHRKDKDFAVSWIKQHGKGRVFYCMFGHLADPFHNPAVQQYYLDGIQYALGDLEADATPVRRPSAAK